MGPSRSRGRLSRKKKPYDIDYRCSGCGRLFTYLARARNHVETYHEGTCVIETLIKDVDDHGALLHENMQLKDEVSFEI